MPILRSVVDEAVEEEVGGGAKFEREREGFAPTPGGGTPGGGGRVR